MKDTSMNAEICRQNLEAKWNGWIAPKYPCIKDLFITKGKNYFVMEQPGRNHLDQV